MRAPYPFTPPGNCNNFKKSIIVWHNSQPSKWDMLMELLATSPSFKFLRQGLCLGAAKQPATKTIFSYYADIFCTKGEVIHSLEWN